MTDDDKALVQRLLRENSMPPYYGVPAIQKEAADRLTALSAEVGRLTVELEEARAHGQVLSGKLVAFGGAAEAREAKLREALEKVQSRIERSFTDRRGEALSWGGARYLLPIIAAALKEATNG